MRRLFNTQKYSNDLTSYDFWKTLAILMVIIDHAGCYFFPDDLLWRAVGRACVPVWMFLIGYARSRDIPVRMWGGAIILLIFSFISGFPVFPMNILILMMLTRLVIDRVMEQFNQSSEKAIFIFAGLFILAIPTGILVDYGTQGFILAMVGYMVRGMEGGSPRARLNVLCFMVLALAAYMMTQQFFFGLTGVPLAVMAVFSGLFMYFLIDFKPRTYPVLTQRLPRVVTGFFMFFGRNTLEIYVIHIVVFSLISTYLGIYEHRFFTLIWLE